MASSNHSVNPSEPALHEDCPGLWPLSSSNNHSLEQPDPEQVNQELRLRCQSLEQSYEALRSQVAQLTSQAQAPEPAVAMAPRAPAPAHAPRNVAPLSPASTATNNMDNEPTPDCVRERSTTFMASPSFYRQLDMLDRLVASDSGKGVGNVESRFDGGQECQAKRLETIPTMGLQRDLDEIIEQTRLQHLNSTYRSMDLFFTHIHPHWSFLNEKHLRTQFAGFLANDPHSMSKSTMIQFTALLNFIVAIERLLYDTSKENDDVPGRKEYCSGDALLSYAASLDKADVTTIELLLVKALYCFFASQFNPAYDTVGMAVRLCFQLGLHNEPSWDVSCTFYNRNYRRRIFWSIYCLNHLVAQAAGVPDLIHESDYDVAYPKCVDDRMLYPRCPSLPEMPKLSPIPYLLEVIKWVKLSSKLWDVMFGVRAKRPISPEFITMMDNKILALPKEAPEFLRWPPVPDKQNQESGFLWAQAFVLYLRTRALRLFLRREEMLSLRYEKQTARVCVEVASELVNAMEVSYSLTPLATHTARYTLALHLTGVLVPVICIIVRPNQSEDMVQSAIGLFYRSLKIMQDLTPGLLFARRTLRQLDRPVRAAQQMINSNWPQYAQSGECFPLNLNYDPSENQEIHTSLNCMNEDSYMRDLDAQVVVMAGRFHGESSGQDAQVPPEELLLWDDINLWNPTSSWYV